MESTRSMGYSVRPMTRSIGRSCISRRPAIIRERVMERHSIKRAPVERVEDLDTGDKLEIHEPDQPQKAEPKKETSQRFKVGLKRLARRDKFRQSHLIARAHSDELRRQHDSRVHSPTRTTIAASRSH